MCWACYTPLSGAAGGGASPAGAAKGAAPAASGEAGDKPKIPPWQIGILGVGLLAGIYVGVKAVMPASVSDEDGEETPTESAPAEPPPADSPAPAAAPTVNNPVVINNNTGTAAVMPSKAPFDIVIPPNPKLSVATMAIVPTEATSSGPQAAALAAYTRRQYTRIKSWNTIYIYVFSDAKSAQYFAEYQIRRKGAPLTDTDLSTLQNLWSSCLARYEYTPARRIERVLYPSRNPGGWWYDRR